LDRLGRWLFGFVTVRLKAALMVPLPATKSRTKMHRVGFIWVVGSIADTREARVKVGLPSHVSSIIIDIQGKYTPLRSRIMSCTLYERKMIRGKWALEEVMSRRTQ
jgi:hypothetical protein